MPVVLKVGAQLTFLFILHQLFQNLAMLNGMYLVLLAGYLRYRKWGAG